MQCDQERDDEKIMKRLNRGFLRCADFRAIAPHGMWHDGEENADYVASNNCYEWYLSYPLNLRRNTARILEIGVRYGYSAVAMMMGATSRSSLVEYWGFDDGSYGADPLQQKDRIQSLFSPGSIEMVLRRVNTQDVGRLDGVIGSFDILHVDALHTAGGEGEVHDLKLVAPFLKRGGIIIVDDATDGRASMMEVIPRVGSELGLNCVYAPTFRGNIILFEGNIDDVFDLPPDSIEEMG